MLCSVASKALLATTLSIVTVLQGQIEIDRVHNYVVGAHQLLQEQSGCLRCISRKLLVTLLVRGWCDTRYASGSALQAAVLSANHTSYHSQKVLASLISDWSALIYGRGGAGLVAMLLAFEC